MNNIAESNVLEIKGSDKQGPVEEHSNDTISLIKTRRSQELIIGLCGAIGSGIQNLKDTLILELEQHGYHVEHIRLSNLIYKASNKPKDIECGFERYNKLQDLGDELRSVKRLSILADLSIGEIAIRRQKLFGKQTTEEAVKVTKKVAYIIDQIKHPQEIELLQVVYRNNFYMLGLLRTENERKENLKDEGISDENVAKLILRDKKDDNKYGQQVEKSLHKADYFIRNIDVAEEINSSISRFIKLIHGTNHITPTNDETGMYSAFSASLRSACLSRQVGASIIDKEGNILSTGCNDVPKFKGGLYTSESKMDMRCFNYSGKCCHNDKHKTLLKREISELLTSLKVENPEDISNKLIDETKIKSLIEYSRAVHAEMDAIVSLARTSNSSTTEKILYCTTYPCHQCARHIVAAGIERVVYIEPYEKSLAINLHSDSICQPENLKKDKVIFENFEGVAPRRYEKFFRLNSDRKSPEGKLLTNRITTASHVDPQYLDSYGEYELKIYDKVMKDFEFFGSD